MNNRIPAVWAELLAKMLEYHRVDLFMNRSNTSLDIGMVTNVAMFIGHWFDKVGLDVLERKYVYPPVSAGHVTTSEMPEWSFNLKGTIDGDETDADNPNVG